MRPDLYGLRFHHFGMAVRSPDLAERFLHGLGYGPCDLIFDPEQGVSVAMYEGEGLPGMELVVAGGQPGPIHNLLKRQETAIYHSCYLTADFENSLARIAADGLDVATVREPRPAILFCGALVSFHYVSGFGLIEFIHTAEEPRICSKLL